MRSQLVLRQATGEGMNFVSYGKGNNKRCAISVLITRMNEVAVKHRLNVMYTRQRSYIRAY